MTNTIRTKLGEGGRVIIPASFRNNLSISQGDDIILHLSEGMICITTPDQSLRKLQAKVKSSINGTNQNIATEDALSVMENSEEADHE